MFEGKSGGKLEVSVKLRRIDKEAKEKLKKEEEELSKTLVNIEKTASSKAKKDQTNHAKYVEEAAQIHNSIYSLFESHDYDLDYGLAYLRASKKLNKLSEAKGKISDIIAKGNNLADLHCLLSYFNKELGNKDAYKQELDEAYALDTNNKNVLNAYGKYYIELGQKDFAKQFLDMSLFLYPDQPDIKAINDKL